MKKIGLFVCAIAMVSAMFTSCKKNGNGGNFDPDVIADGMYVIGEGTGVANFDDVKTASKMLMCQGINEASGEVRPGMFEKYLYLEEGKDFELILVDGDDQTIYGGALAPATLVADKGDIDGFFCLLEKNVKMQVPATGFYHVVLDVDQDGLLAGAGGAQIIVAPVSWGISGDCNGWGMTLGEKVEDRANNTITWTWKDVVFKANNEFKFKDENGWKIFLDGTTQQVSANTNLGKDMLQGGANIVVEEAGIYTITLTWTVAKGAMANNYVMDLKRTGDRPIVDYSNTELCVVGEAVIDQEGAEADPDGDNGGWSWGNRFNMGTPVKDGNIYTWTATMELTTAGCKVRSYDTRDENFYQSANDRTIETAGTYVVTVTINAETDEVTEEFKSDADPSEPVIITVRAKYPAEWTETPTAWVWPTGAEGEEVVLEEDNGYYTYTTPAPVQSLNIIFKNGEGWTGDQNQTVDITGIKEDKTYVITFKAGEKATVAEEEE